MNAPDLQKPLPLVIGLAGAPHSGRKTIAKYLKRRHGFATSHFMQPVLEAVQALYGVSPAELLFGDRDLVIERLGKTPRELIEPLRAHGKTVAGNDLLLRRLVERTATRGEWGQQDLVITDITEEVEIQWIRLMRGQIWWIRRPSQVPCRAIEDLERLVLLHFDPVDTVIVNGDSVEKEVDGAYFRALDGQRVATAAEA